ncbi:cyclic-nucleotide gated cation channel [Aphelenchoides avenae]|nr:cyclic-nucleotide gated cation channel [Aphelenchus avenae]
MPNDATVEAGPSLEPPQAPAGTGQKRWRKGAVIGRLRSLLPSFQSSTPGFQRQLSDIDTSGQQAAVEFETDAPGWAGKTIDAESSYLYAWDFVITLCCLYNLWAIPLLAFEDAMTYHLNVWYAGNLLADLAFFADIPLQCWISFYHEGIKVRNVRIIARRYCHSRQFAFDLIAVLPTDLLMLRWRNLFVFRLNHVTKCYRIFDFLSKAQMRTDWPNAVVLAKLIVPIIFIFHWNACAFYALSIYADYREAKATDWPFTYDKIHDPVLSDCNWLPWDRDCAFDEAAQNATTKQDYVELMEDYWYDKVFTVNFTDFAKKYTLSFYWSSMTITTLGEQPEPDYSFENTFEIFDTVIGILIFGAIMGSVAEIVGNTNLTKREIRAEMDKAKLFMKNRRVIREVQERIFDYFTYTMSQERAFDEEAVISPLPTRLRHLVKADIVVDHLRRVPLFKGINGMFLEELVRHVKHSLFAPNDLLCYQGDLSREFFMVTSGRLAEVSDGVVLREINEGESYGDFALIDVPGHVHRNRWPSSLRSVGFSDVYVLLVDDFRDVLADFPELATMLECRAIERLRVAGYLSDVDGRAGDEQTKTVEGRLSTLEKALADIDKALRAHIIKSQRTKRQFNRKLDDIETALRRRERVSRRLLAPLPSRRTPGVNVRRPTV